MFTSTRAIGSFGNTLIAGDLKPTADGKGKALLVASKTPSDPNSYKVIADMASFDNLPAIHRQDVNGGGGIYQVQEFNGKLYVVVCTGDTSTLKERPEPCAPSPFTWARTRAIPPTRPIGPGVRS